MMTARSGDSTSEAETLTETERAFQLGFVSISEAILMAIRLVSFLIIGIIMAVVAEALVAAIFRIRRVITVLIVEALGRAG
jgi:putative ABC transport system permease protein